MQFLLNGTKAAGVTREQFIEYVKQPMDPEEWELVKRGIISHLLFKTGKNPGMLIIIHADNMAEAEAAAANSPIVKKGFIDFFVDPINRFPHFD